MINSQKISVKGHALILHGEVDRSEPHRVWIHAKGLRHDGLGPSPVMEQCDKCSHQSGTKGNHLREHACVEGDLKWKYKSGLGTHMIQIHVNKKYYCRQCHFENKTKY